jgi:hypothetical protein
MEELCIYYKSRPDLTFNTEEHIFPAGLGGRMTLQQGMVSLEFNNDISAVELTFMRDSVIALPRQLLGPGKRGKTGDKHATRSRIHLIENFTRPGVYSLGYIKAGKPEEIPQININLISGAALFSVPGIEQSKAQEKLLKLLEAFNEGNVRYKKDARIGETDIIIGFDKNILVYTAPETKYQIDLQYAKRLHELLSAHHSDPAHLRFHIKTKQDVTVGEDFYRICAKTAFNVLAQIKGKDFVMSDEFDRIRDYIAFGGDDDLVCFGREITDIIAFPVHSHWVVISARGHMLFADVSFYNHFGGRVILSDKHTGYPDTDGMICDWKNNEEYRLIDYIIQFGAMKFESLPAGYCAGMPV